MQGLHFAKNYPLTQKIRKSGQGIEFIIDSLSEDC